MLSVLSIKASYFSLNPSDGLQQEGAPIVIIKRSPKTGAVLNVLVIMVSRFLFLQQRHCIYLASLAAAYESELLGSGGLH